MVNTEGRGSFDKLKRAQTSQNAKLIDPPIEILIDYITFRVALNGTRMDMIDVAFEEKLR